MKDSLGNDMKVWENTRNNGIVTAQDHVYMRFDGRSFSKFTRGMDRPYDVDMMHAMQETTACLIKETNASMGYCQSDEISIGWKPSDNPTAQFMFGGKSQKLLSVLASFTTVTFCDALSFWKPDYAMPILPTFDARIVNFNAQGEDMRRMFLWRFLDAKRNAVSQYARAFFSHSELMYKNTGDMMEMLREHPDANFGGTHSEFRFGTFFNGNGHQIGQMDFVDLFNGEK